MRIVWTACGGSDGGLSGGGYIVGIGVLWYFDGSFNDFERDQIAGDASCAFVTGSLTLRIDLILAHTTGLLAFQHILPSKSK